MFDRARLEIANALTKDPAARSKLEVIFTYPGLHAIWIYRFTHWLWINNWKLIAKMISQFARFMTGIEIHPGATIGTKVFIDHGMGVVIGETAEIFDEVTIYQGVTLGGVSLQKMKRHPTIHSNVIIGAGAKVLGDIVIGSGTRIGANAVVVKSAPENSVIVGVPGQVVIRSKRDDNDLEPKNFPDTIGESLISLMYRVDQIEDNLKLTSKKIHEPKEGCWQGEDFMI